MADAHAEMSPLEAYRSVLGFAAERGENALRLALHAALPQVLRPELLHLIRLNFVPEALDDTAAEADVLFAPFCAELGNGYFRFDSNARLHLLTQLDPAYADDADLRSRQVAGFLLAWCRREGGQPMAEDDRVFAAFLDVERWVALAFFDPNAAAQQLAAAVRQASEAGSVAARIRIGGLASALATPLAAHGRLLAYAAGLEALERGDEQKARDFLEPLGDREVRVGGITLRSPWRLLEERRRRVEPAAPAPLEPEPQAEPKKSSRDLIFYLSSSYSDLIDYREEVFKAVLRLGHQVIGRESYHATAMPSVTDLNKKIADSDAVILLVAWRYGFVLPYGNGRSIVELEYRETRRLGKPVFVFLVAGEAPWPEEFMDAKSPAGDHGERINRFRSELAETHAVAYFTSPDDLAAKIAEAITAWQANETVPTGEAIPQSAPVFSLVIQPLLAELARPETPHRRRLEIGDTLEKLGDPRPGVGLRPDGVPDLLWLKVPGGTVRLEGIDKTFEVRPFHIAQYPVTYCQYRAFLDDPKGYANPAWWTGLRQEKKPGEQRWLLGNRPAERVSWYDAVAYARWLSARLGYEARLPTEWEWQQAAAGGEPDREYPWGNEWDAARANTYESELGQTTAVGMYPLGASPVGALDLAGNVWEWCLNERSNPDRQGIEGDARRAVRGGSWYDHHDYARCAFRGNYAPFNRDRDLGLRLVCVPPIA